MTQLGNDCVGGSALVAQTYVSRIKRQKFSRSTHLQLVIDAHCIQLTYFATPQVSLAKRKPILFDGQEVALKIIFLG